MNDCIINRDRAAWVKANADIEHENELPDESIVSAALDTLILGPYTTVAQIGEMCRAFSDDEYEVSFRVAWIGDKPVAYPVREARR